MHHDFSIEQILQRYQLAHKSELLYNYEVLQSMNINKDFIYTLLETFENPLLSSKEHYDKYGLDVIIDYIQRTHTFYLSKKLLEIEQSIHILLEDLTDQHPLLNILHAFYTDYSIELKAHIYEEEKVVLPYINSLSKILESPDSVLRYHDVLQAYSLQTFIDEHADTEEDLVNVRWAIQSHQPPKTNHTPYRILMAQLESFERDLAVHAIIEDEVLMPRALAMESQVKSILKAALS